MPMLDLFDQVVVTEFVKREYDALVRSAGGGEDRSTSYGARILPLTPHNGRHVRVRYQDVLGPGMAQFKAPGAAPALWAPKRNLRERMMELVDIDEMHRIDPVEMLALKSPDPNVLADAQVSLADRASESLARNELRTEWMRWEALKGNLVVPYPDGPSISVNYGIPTEHFPEFDTPWTDKANSNPLDDLDVLGAVAIPASGIYLSHFHMSHATHRLLKRSKSTIDYLSSYGRDVILPTDADIKEILRDGSKFTITDDGRLAENSTAKELIKWIPDGKVFATTPDYTYMGRKIGDMKDGWVLLGGPTDSQQPIAKRGTQSEWIYNRLGQQTLFRQAAARMPVIEAPEALAWATAFDPADL